MRGTDYAAMVVAARALGRLAQPGGTLTAELVEAEVKGALEWLQLERTENRRFAAVLILRELAKNSPTLMYQWIAQIFELIWVALRDPKVLIRESAAEAISACFEIISPRDSQMRQLWFGRVYDEILKGFALNTNEAIHGSLLTMKELLDKSAMFMNEQKYRETVETVLKYREHRDALVPTRGCAHHPDPRQLFSDRVRLQISAPMYGTPSGSDPQGSRPRQSLRGHWPNCQCRRCGHSPLPGRYTRFHSGRPRS